MQSKDEVKVLLFAGGESSRFWPFNSFVEKSLLPLENGKPMIREIFERLTGFSGPWREEDVIILCHEKHRMMFAHEFRDTKAHIDALPMYFGTMTHFKSAVERFPAENYVVHYCDMITDIPYDRLEVMHKGSPYLGTIVTYKVRSPYSEAVVKEGRVTDFWEKPLVSGPIWTGVAMFHRNVWKAMDLVKVAEGSTMPDIGRDLLPHMAQNRILGAYQHSGKWVDLGNLHNYQKYVARYNAVWDH